MLFSFITKWAIKRQLKRKQSDGFCPFGETKRLVLMAQGKDVQSLLPGIQDENGEALKKKTEAVPENGWIYNSAFRDSILDDYLSVRGLKRLSREIMGEEMDGKRLSELCSEKNPGALKVYREFGKILYEGILPFLDSFKPQALILGGQITKSFPYFGEKLEKACKERSITLIMEENTSLRAMQGLLF